MAKRHLLPPTPQYKANLHTHSRVSDGRHTPQEVKEMYKGAGYQILALTDHNIMADHSGMNEEDFLMLTGGEFNLNEPDYTPTRGRYGKSYHLNLIAKRPDNLWQPFPSPGKREFAQPYEALTRPESMSRDHTLACANAIIARANEMGFLVSYNHPVWSLHAYEDWSGLEGLWAMEVCNTGCVCYGRDEHNAGIYQAMLTMGKYLCPVAADDMHAGTMSNGSSDFAGAWNMVCAPRLDYESVITALERGDFYASLGPAIHSLTIEDGVVELTCSGAVRVSVQSDCRYAALAVPGPGEEELTRARFDLTDFLERSQGVEGTFVRFTVTDSRGRYAMTRAYRDHELREG